MIRPKPARWFEILAARDDATLVLEALATTGAVELEAVQRRAAGCAADLRPQLSEFAELIALSRVLAAGDDPASRFPSRRRSRSRAASRGCARGPRMPSR
jgi:hypothetical protein